MMGGPNRHVLLPLVEYREDSAAASCMCVMLTGIDGAGTQQNNNKRRGPPPFLMNLRVGGRPARADASF